MTNPSTWLIYIRKSVVRNDTDLESPERQLYVCQTRLSLLPGPIKTEVYTDLDRSGSNEAGRPAWLDLKAQLARPDVAGVVASSLDRLYRNLPEFLAFLNLIEETGKQLIISKENVDTSPDNPMGRFFVSIMMSMYEMEWRLTSKRMRDMVADKRHRQGRHWGPAPFGTERDAAGQLAPTSTTDPNGRHLFDALGEMFRLFSSGKYSYESLAGALNAEGWQYQDRWGKFGPFTHEHTREILARWRLYRGDLPLGNARKKNQIEWLKGGHAPILPVELCDEVAAQLDRRNRPYKARQTNRIYLLSGLLRCAGCGGKLGGQKYNGRYYYRHALSKHDCPAEWVEARIIEQQMVDAVIELGQHPEMLAGMRTKLRTVQAAPHAPATDSHQRLRANLDRLEDLYITGGIERDSYLRKRGRILSDLASMEQPQRQPVNAAYLENVTASLHLITHASPYTQRELMSTLFTDITAAGQQIKTATPNSWAKPFFILCEKWAGWGINPDNTKPILLSWLTYSPAL